MWWASSYWSLLTAFVFILLLFAVSLANVLSSSLKYTKIVIWSFFSLLLLSELDNIPSLSSFIFLNLLFIWSTFSLDSIYIFYARFMFVIFMKHHDQLKPLWCFNYRTSKNFQGQMLQSKMQEVLTFNQMWPFEKQKKSFWKIFF